MDTVVRKWILTFIIRWFILETNCYSGNGRYYAGQASTTINGSNCIDWNRVSANYYLPVNDNHCRNPNETQAAPWCYTSVGNNPSWDYCNITQCSIPENRGLTYDTSSR